MKVVPALRRWRGVVVAVLAAGCTPSSTSTEVERESIKWAEAPGGGQVRVSKESLEGFRSETVDRCWPSGKGYSCLSVYALSVDSGTQHFIKRYRVDQLASDAQPEPQEDESPYGCTLTDSAGAFVTESINRGGAKLIENTMTGIGTSERPWSRSYVQKFLAENGLPSKDAYFDCPKVAGVITKGSMASLSTTLVQRSAIGF